jgi:hypothetical protein
MWLEASLPSAVVPARSWLPRGARPSGEATLAERESGALLEGFARALYLAGDYRASMEVHKRAFATFKEEDDRLGGADVRCLQPVRDRRLHGHVLPAAVRAGREAGVRAGGIGSGAARRHEGRTDGAALPPRHLQVLERSLRLRSAWRRRAISRRVSKSRGAGVERRERGAPVARELVAADEAELLGGDGAPHVRRDVDPGRLASRESVGRVAGLPMSSARSPV